ncbi:class I SAM-dependent methyltransferase [Conexibacter woesei]|uniref:class I SAM-dependent methyltransferase n=1 Tax=Conexibacter woesei TaxID=191495 RepID=UPI000685F318|nr:class I SAM-dependent methyltransferase [Conexibacter woesei]
MKTSLWDPEYQRGGVPSSVRESPSGALVWALDNWSRLDRAPAIGARGLDVGCGTGRNTAHLVSRGFEMTAFDSSEVAIERARQRFAGRPEQPELLLHDLTDGLPVASGSIDFIVDTFVYKHQVEPSTRRAYRAEMSRVLKATGRVLISVAEPDDDYYGACPSHPSDTAGPHAVIDPALDVGSVLFSARELMEDVADCLQLEMVWRKERPGEMHGAPAVRRTMATIWRRRAAQ